jgi:hypothetical protein
VIGYSYLVNTVTETSKGADYYNSPISANASSTNELIADANYWTPAQIKSGGFAAMLKVAPHTSMGAAMSKSSSFTVGLNGVNSASLGAAGGNIGYLDWSVRWRNITQMGTYTASSESDGYANW